MLKKILRFLLIIILIQLVFIPLVLLGTCSLFGGAWMTFSGIYQFFSLDAFNSIGYIIGGLGLMLLAFLIWRFTKWLIKKTTAKKNSEVK